MKIISLLKIILSVFSIMTLLVLSALVYSTINERNIYNDKEELISLGNELMSVSDFLTEQARYYAQTGQKEYFDAYLRETQIVKTREKVQVVLINKNAPLSEIELLNKAAELSFTLEKLELKAFDMISNDNLEGAIKLLFSEEYKQGKQPIVDTITAFQKSIQVRTDEELGAAKDLANLSIAITIISLLIMFFVTFFISGSIGKRIKSVNELSLVAKSISEGDFDVKLDKKSLGYEFDALTSEFEAIINTIKLMLNEISNLILNISAGNLSFRTNATDFNGDWSKVLVGLNTAVISMREQIIEESPIAYIAIIDDHVVDCNKYASNHIGVEIGAHMEDYYVDKKHRHDIYRRLKIGQTLTREYVTLKDIKGIPRRFVFNVNVVRALAKPSIIVWAMDVEEQEQQNDIIRRNKEDMQRVINALPISMAIINSETGKIEYKNADYCKMFECTGLTAAEYEKWTFSQNQQSGPSAVLKDTQIKSEVINTGKAYTTEFTYITIGLKEINTRIIANEIFYNNESCILKIIQDISEETIRNKLLENAAKQEREANVLKSSFLANMSHEIRTPMNAVIGLSQLALMKKQEPENAETFRKINQSSKNLLNIINDILDFSKIEAEKIDLVDEVFVLEDVIANAFLVASEHIGDKRIEMLFDMTPEIPYNLIGDKTRLWQVLKNLLDNSAKYTNEGCVILEAFINEQNDSEIVLCFKITDTGIGMSEEQIKSVFTPFYQTTNSTGNKQIGTGLGMSITKQLIDLMNGSIEIESEPDIGTQITVAIPFKYSENNITLANFIESKNAKSTPILIVDDDMVSCEIMQRMLDVAGFASIAVNTGKEALRLVSERNGKSNQFKVIILDYMLGDENGITLAREIAKISEQTKLLMVSAYVKSIPEEEMREVGFKDVLKKPLVPSAFIRRLCDTIDDVYVNEKLGLVNFKNARVLVCEDNEINQEVATEMLKTLGIEADVAENGFQGIEKLEKNAYDLVLMDILMPVLDGKEATRRIRRGNSPYKDICIIALTANVLLDQVNSYLELGMNGYITKPIEFNELYSKMLKYIPKEKQIDPVDELMISYEAEFEIDGVNTSEGVARFAGKADRYKKALLRFAKEYVTPVIPPTPDELKLYVHTIKGVSANLGIKALSELAASIEKEGLVSDSLTSFKVSLVAVCEGIIAVLDSDETAARTFIKTESGTKEDFQKTLEKLRTALEESNPTESETLLSKLWKTEWDNVKELDLKPLLTALDNYDFSLALNLLNLMFTV